MTQAFTLAVLLVVALNVVFLLLAVGAVMLPREHLVDRVRQAFSAGDLVEQDYLPFDSRRGFHQYDDCIVLEMITSRQGSILADALGPQFYVKDDTWSEVCSALRTVIFDEAAKAKMVASSHTRYWHGYNVTGAGLLLFLELAQVRWVFKVLLYSTLISLPFAAGWKDRRLFGYAVALAVAGLAFWAIPQFGQLLSQAPGDSLAVLGIAGVLGFRERLSRLGALVPFCAAYGAGAAYLDFLTGVLPTAGGWLFATAFLTARARPTCSSAMTAWGRAVQALAAFALGVIVTVALKQGLSTVVFGAAPLKGFISHLTQWTTSVQGDESVPGIYRPFAALVADARMLTYGNQVIARLLLGTTSVAWICAGYLALRHARSDSVSEFLALVVGAGAVPVWMMLMQTHTVTHSPFMVRIMIVPISLGWAALAWQILDRLDAPAARVSSFTKANIPNS